MEYSTNQKNLSNIKANTSIICKSLSYAKIPHIIGGASFVGLTSGELTKYSDNVTLYIFNYNIFKLIPLFIILLWKRILLKPKYISGHWNLKLREKTSLFKKSHECYRLYPGIIDNDNYKFFINSRYILFDVNDLSEKNISTFEIENHFYSLLIDKHIFCAATQALDQEF